MPHILNPEQLSKQRIELISKELGVSDAQLVENCLHAFILLGHLSTSGLPFLFKGGTSVLLHARILRRLSIDIDIMCPVSGEELVSQPWMDVIEEAHVTVPTIPALLGDKLTAFAPNTIGVRYQNEKGEEGDLMQIGKQLFDIGELFNLCRDLSACHRSHRASFEKENGYRDGKFTYEQVLDDTLAAALDASFRNKVKPENHDRMIQRCVRPLAGHLAGCTFGATQAAEAAGKVALLVSLLRPTEPPPPISPQDFAPPADLMALKDVQIGAPWSFLRSIKASAPHAFHYWHQAQRIMADGKQRNPLSETAPAS